MRPVIHVGLHKTATSWLQRVFFPAVGHLANESRTPWGDRIVAPLVTGEGRPPSLAAEGWIVSAERLSGFPASGWSDADRIAARLHRWAPDAKIIVGTRDVETWVPSLYREMIYEGDPRKLETMLEPWWKVPTFDLRAVSEEALEERYARFGSLLLLPFELLVEDPEAYVKTLCDFMRVPTPPDLDMSPVNQKSDAWLELRRVLNHFRKTELNPQPIIDATPLVERMLKRL